MAVGRGVGDMVRLMWIREMPTPPVYRSEGMNSIDVYCHAKGCKRYLYSSEPPIPEKPLCDECRIKELEQEVERLRGALEKIIRIANPYLEGGLRIAKEIAEQALKGEETI